MLRKSLLLAACFCLLSAPVAMAHGTNFNYLKPASPVGMQAIPYYGHDMCYTGKNGSGRAIPSIKSEEQCMQNRGQSWGQPGEFDTFNFER